MTTHTPGPWFNDPTQPTVWDVNQTIKIATIEDLPWIEHPITGRRYSDFDTEKANARLVAASPDLLDALQWLKQCTEELIFADGEARNHAMQDVRHALERAGHTINQATGQS